MKHEKLTIIAGPMFSGKTTELIRIAQRYIIAKKKIVLFKHLIDDRFSQKLIVSHDRKTIGAYPATYPYEMEQKLDFDEKAVFFDEVQFFDESVVGFIKRLLKFGIKVYCSGLDQNYLGEPFKVVADLMAEADDVLKLSAVCVECGDKAVRTYRLGESTEEIEVGAEEKYSALCRTCFERKMSIK